VAFLGAKNAAWDSLAADELRVEPWSLPLAVYHGRWLMNIATARRAQGGRGGAGAIVKSRRCNGLAKLSFSKYFDLARTPIVSISQESACQLAMMRKSLRPTAQHWR
jgi:hypothetical protein